MSRHIMLVPSLSCPASCYYCFGPHEGGQSMCRETIEAVVAWQKIIDNQEKLEITFHGGEPLVPGAEFYRMALPLLQDGLAARRVRFAIQSNLWLFTNELGELLREYKVSIGSSLDGPREINDAQRGEGYFQKTMASIERARSHGINVGCICTFTHQSLPNSQEIFDFFLREELDFTVHSASPSIRYAAADHWALSAEEHGELLVSMLDRYLANLDKVRISTLDSMCHSVSTGHGSICTFGNCLGGFLAVGPDGQIYPCQRFTGMPEYQLGSVQDCPSQAALADSPVWQILQKRQETIADACTGCAFLDICQGGCPYNALVANGGNLAGFKNLANLRDPNCPAYQRTFRTIKDRAMQEVFSDENLEDVIRSPDPEKGFLRHGRLLSIMSKGPHPHETAQHALRILEAASLAATASPLEATRKLQMLGLVTNAERAGKDMQALHKHLNAAARGLNNIYLHVTFACNLRCDHCYAQAGPSRKGALPVAELAEACRQAAQAGFRHAVITGGEPLIYPQRDALLETLAALRQQVKPLLTVLRTSLALPVDEGLLQRLGSSTDQVVVSLDGDRATHDAQRGSGSYDLTVSNLRALAALRGGTEISLASVLPMEQANGAPGEAVRALAKELGIRRTRFRPLLPLGRAVESKLDILPETVWGHLDPCEMMAHGFSPAATCGFGQNLYVEPDGSAYPCYAWHEEAWLLGRINTNGGLSDLLASPAFQELGKHTVNTNQRCCLCTLRYLCGGACRAWSHQPSASQTDLDAPPADCSYLFGRARSLLVSALGRLGLTPEEWQAAGLALPDKPPECLKIQTC